MSEEKEQSYLDYDFEDFRERMIDATKLLKKMNAAANAMRWQYEMGAAMEEFTKELNEANGWLSSWCA